MKLQEKFNKKQAELREAIDNATAINDNPDSEQRSIDEALEAVKVLEDDVKNIKTLLDAEKSANGDEEDKSGDEPKSKDDSKGDEDDDENRDGEPVVEENKEKESEAREMPLNITQNSNPKNEKRDALNAFIRSRGEARADGLKSDDAGVLIPEEIINNPDIMIETTTDLTKLVNVTNVKTASGKYPILERPSTTLPSVEELKKNPELAKPKFTDVDWEVATHRGALPIAEEAIADASVDLVSLVSQFINEIKVNTTNSKIAKVLSQFTKKTVATIDELKDLNNTGFDPAYQLSWVMTKSFYNELDKFKDGEGRYLLQDQIGTATGKTLFGHNLIIVEDTAFGGADGDKQAFIGDLKRAVLYANRVEANVNWIDNDVYGRVLMAVIRFGVAQADEKAGYFVNFNGLSSDSNDNSDDDNSDESQTPTEASTVAEINQWLDDHDINHDGITKKDDLLALIND